jgi:PKD repeat protein
VRRPALLLLLCGLAACGGSDLLLPGVGEPADIHVVGGDGQHGIVGELLASPIVIEVTDAAGRPVPGAVVEFTLTSAGQGGEIAPSSVATGAEGRAEARVLLGSKTGLQTGEARLALDGLDAPRTSFTALAELPAPPDNVPPVADFQSSCTDLTCAFTDRSSDADGTLAGWSWEFGDGTGSDARHPGHSYAAPGTYTVTLVVTDDGGAGDQVSSQVTVSAPAAANQPPRAEFTVECRDLACDFADRSSDDGGTIVSRAWEFGDGTTSTAASPSHTYAAAGRYQVRLTVRDDDGAEDSRTHDADPSAPPPPPDNKPPRADFDVRCDKLACRFTDKSKDDDGSVVAWAWNFGDGGTTGERNPVHTYTTPGKYDVVLTVTDDLGATATKVKGVDAKR